MGIEHPTLDTLWLANLPIRPLRLVFQKEDKAAANRCPVCCRRNLVEVRQSFDMAVLQLDDRAMARDPLRHNTRSLAGMSGAGDAVDLHRDEDKCQASARHGISSHVDSSHVHSLWTQRPTVMNHTVAYPRRQQLGPRCSTIILEYGKHAWSTCGGCRSSPCNSVHLRVPQGSLGVGSDLMLFR